MTSKAAVSPAAQDLKASEVTDLATREDVKASATSATDEPTNSSSAPSLVPPKKKERQSKGPSEASKPGVGSFEAHLAAPNSDRSVVKEQPPAAEASATQPPADISDLRKLARQPGSR